MNRFYHDPDAPVQPDQFAVEFAALLTIFDQCKPRSILEIGVREGGTLYQWIKHAQPGAQIVAIDLPGVSWGRSGTEQPEAWQAWAAERGVCLTVILADSHDPETIWKACKFMPFDFIFIDGDHSFNGVAADFLSYAPMVGPGGGVIALHDICPDSADKMIEGWKLWRILRGAAYRTAELLSEYEQDSRGIGVVYV